MTAMNCTVKKRSKQPSISIDDIFTTNQGCTVRVIGYLSSKKVLVKYNDDFNHRVYVTAQNLRNGNLKNPYRPNIYGVGFFGVGEFRGSFDGKPTPEYDAWRSMLARCYDSKTHKVRPTYIDCSVDSNWHNFQVFAKWYVNHQNYGLGYHLDKDILIDGNKVYSESTCLLIPLEINCLLGNTVSGRILPAGVTYNKSKGMYEAQLGIRGASTYLGSFDDPDEAHKAYVIAKERMVKDSAKKWASVIGGRAFDALMAWRVKA